MVIYTDPSYRKHGSVGAMGFLKPVDRGHIPVYRDDIGQIRARERGLLQLNALNHCASKIRVGQVSAIEVGEVEVGSREVRAPEVHVGKIATTLAG